MSEAPTPKSTSTSLVTPTPTPLARLQAHVTSPAFKIRLMQGVAMGLLIGTLLALLRWQGVFTHTRLRFNDVYFTTTETSGAIVIVAIDDASLARFGRTPAEWSRTVFADLAAALNTAGARVVAFDILFAEPTEDDEALVDALISARESDARTRFVMPVVGAERRIDLNEADTGAITYLTALKPLPELLEVVDYVGYVNVIPDGDNVLRRQPSLVRTASVNGASTDSTVDLSFSLATYLAYLRVPSSAIGDLIESEPGQLHLTPERALNVDEAGLWRSMFFGAPAAASSQMQTFKAVSLVDVIDGIVEPETFDDKIVLVGLMNSSGLSDRFPSPFNGAFMSGVEIFAHAIETLVQGRMTYTVSLMSELVTILLLAAGVGAIYRAVSWLWGLLAAAALVLLWLIFAFARFDTSGEMATLFYPALALILPYFAVLGQTITLEITRRSRAEFLLESVTAVAHQRLDLARILPRIADDLRRELQAPAGEIRLRGDETEQKPDLRPVYTWSSSEKSTNPPVSASNSYFDAICGQVQREKRPVSLGDQIAVPVLWQGDVLAVMAMQIRPEPLPGRADDKLRRLTALAEKIAPSLDNALLYTQTQRQTALLETVLAESPSGIALLNRENVVIKANRCLTEQVFSASESVVGKDLFVLLEAEGAVAETVASVRENCGKAEAFTVEITIHKQTYNLDTAYLPDSDLAIMMFNDVTSLADLSALKTRMLRMVSHDLKSPLNVVTGYADLMLEIDDSPLTAKQREYLESIMRAGRHMAAILRNILNLELLRSGQVTRRAFNITKMVEEILDRHADELKSKRHTLTRELTPDLPLMHGDDGHLGQAFSNLVSNAIKYTPDGGQISVRLFEREDMMVIEVKDNGYGISEADQEKLFREFFRAKTPVSVNVQGTGLGLSLVKSIVEAHSGRVTVKSEQGIGSTFTMELPYAQQKSDVVVD